MQKLLLCAGLLFVASTIWCKPSIPKGIKEEKNAFHRVLEVNSERKKSEKFSSSEDVQLLEGDIVITKKLMSLIEQMKANKSRLSAFDAKKNGEWPNGIVPYLIDKNMTAQDHIAINGAIAEFKEKTCIRFVPKTNEHTSYIIFVKKDGCYSSIGLRGGSQDISLGNGCGYKGIAIHEMMHALGFYHEQSRRDRDSYVRVNFENIEKENSYNFDMYRDGAASTLGESYDKKSIMHYNSYSFSKNGQKTIVSLANSDEVLGQKEGLSEIDVRQLNKYYNCKGTTGPSGCEDKHPFCADIYHWCLKNEFVKSNCKTTCKTCL